MKNRSDLTIFNNIKVEMKPSTVKNGKQNCKDVSFVWGIQILCLNEIDIEEKHPHVNVLM